MVLLIVLGNSLVALGGISISSLAHFPKLGPKAHGSPSQSALMSGNQSPSTKHVQDPGIGSTQHPCSSSSITSLDATSSHRQSLLICCNRFTSEQGIVSKCRHEDTSIVGGTTTKETIMAAKDLFMTELGRSVCAGMTYEYMYMYPQGGKSIMALPGCDLSVVSCELLALILRSNTCCLFVGSSSAGGSIATTAVQDPLVL